MERSELLALREQAHQNLLKIVAVIEGTYPDDDDESAQRRSQFLRL